MKILYCRHCKKDVPMFDDLEIAHIKKIYMDGVRAVKAYRREHQVRLSDVPMKKVYASFYEEYRKMTGEECPFDPFHVQRRHYTSRWKVYREQFNL